MRIKGKNKNFVYQNRYKICTKKLIPIKTLENTRF
nr:MAG TPA: hypothetical protein [Caudoviricetes sp.]